jgi:hypothetical protein
MLIEYGNSVKKCIDHKAISYNAVCTHIEDDVGNNVHIFGFNGVWYVRRLLSAQGCFNNSIEAGFQHFYSWPILRQPQSPRLGSI